MCQSVIECVRGLLGRLALFLVFRLCNQFLILRPVLLRKKKDLRISNWLQRRKHPNTGTRVSVAPTEIKYTIHIVHRCFDRWRCRCFAVHVRRPGSPKKRAKSQAETLLAETLLTCTARHRHARALGIIDEQCVRMQSRVLQASRIAWRCRYVFVFATNCLF